MILIADGGSTKTDWCLADQGRIVKRLATIGANPFFRMADDMAAEWRDNLLPALAGYPVEAVRFYGAGCASDEKSNVVREALAACFDCPDVRVASDLLGAAVGLCGHRAGIACILGTGSNSCFYDGERITENVPSLGYVLGDEGSGAVLGRLFIGACLKGQLTPGLREEMLAFLGMTTAQILDRVYSQPMPNRFLASLCPFIGQHVGDPSVRELVRGAFADFLQRNVMQYDYRHYAASFVGSVAHHFADVLRQAARDCGVTIGTIAPSPMEGLVRECLPNPSQGGA